MQYVILPGNLAWQWCQSVFYHKMGSFCIYKQLKRISILCYGEFIESIILHNIRCLSFSVVYKCRRIPFYDLKYTLTSLSSKVDREYIHHLITQFKVSEWPLRNRGAFPRPTLYYIGIYPPTNLTLAVAFHSKIHLRVWYVPLMSQV